MILMAHTSCVSDLLYRQPSTLEQTAKSMQKSPHCSELSFDVWIIFCWSIYETNCSVGFTQLTIMFKAAGQPAVSFVELKRFRVNVFVVSEMILHILIHGIMYTTIVVFFSASNVPCICIMYIHIQQELKDTELQQQ